jgi:hypothetical protein
MIGPGDVAMDRRIAALAPVPEAGHWFVGEDPEVEGEAWIRVFDAENEDRRAIDLVWERLRHLEHGSIPRALGVDREAGALVLAAPVGVSLEKLLALRHEKDFVMTPATVLDVARQLSDVLVHAHERGRPHGHLSPGSIWVTPLGRLVVWGFGVGPDAAPDPRWVAPERARGKRASGDADQWALAAIVASLVTGRVPWTDDHGVELNDGDASHLVVPVMEQWSPLGRLVERALATEPKDRFPSVHPLRQAFAALGQRVRQQSDLPTMGRLIMDRFGSGLPERGPREPVVRRPSPMPLAVVAPVGEDEIGVSGEDDAAPVEPSPAVPLPGPILPDAPDEEEVASKPSLHAETDAFNAALAASWAPVDEGTRPTAVPGLIEAGTVWREAAIPPVKSGGARAPTPVVHEEQPEPPAKKVRPPRPPGERLVVDTVVPAGSGAAVGITAVAPWLVGVMFVLLVGWLWWRM